MSANAGPDIVEDGIVFYYDTGNTVKSYIGEPTTNQFTNSNFTNGTTGWTFGSWDGGRYLYSVENVVGPFGEVVPALKITRTSSDTSYAHFHQGNGGKYSNGNTYTLSAYVKGAGTLGQYNQGGFTPLNYNPGQFITLSSTWQRVDYTLSSQTDSNYPYWAAENITQNVPMYFVFAQSELKTHPTQYTPSSRSVTQGLLDMTRAGTINLTDVSFDSNAQMVFDGTNDTVPVNSYPAIELVDNVSIEYVYMRLATDPILDVIANKYHSTGWELFCTTANTFALGGRNGDGTYYSTSNAAYVIENNKYYHLIAMKEGLSWRLYVNGQLYASLTANTIGTWSNTGILQIGGEGAGYYPSMKLPLFKIYNRVLTASEVLTNYNALKTRFGI